MQPDWPIAARLPNGIMGVMPTVFLRSPHDGECAALSELCLRSKAVWGYDAAFLDACRAELAIGPSDLAAGLIRVAQLDGRLAGIVQLTRDGIEMHLDKLFVDPEMMGAGVGLRLFEWAVARAAQLGAETLIIDADPGAAGFYRRMGARDIGLIPSGAIPGRFLPRLELAVSGGSISGSA